MMLFIGGKAVALSTSHSLTCSAETSDTSSKDSGVWTDNEITSMSWEASSESLLGAKQADAVDISYEELMDAYLAASPVEVVLGIPKNASPNEVPDGGWEDPSKNAGQVYYKGTANITQLQITAANKENGTMSVSLQGKGQLRKAEGAAAGGGTTGKTGDPKAGEAPTEEGA